MITFRNLGEDESQRALWCGLSSNEVLEPVTPYGLGRTPGLVVGEHPLTRP
jgi:hypothetical protein